jgi:predicted nucleotidyltransferase component of viral defense system
MLSYEVINQETLGLLRKINEHPLFSDYRLVGGTALALLLGHRKSMDLDFFGNTSIDPYDLSELFRSLGSSTFTKSSARISSAYISDVKVDVVWYPYPWIDDLLLRDGIRLAAVKDIAAMKISAITNRGTKKDFWDLYFLLQQYSLADLLNFYEKKYPDSSRFLALKSLLYFEDAEEDVDPQALIPVTWDHIKTVIKEETEKCLQ